MKEILNGLEKWRTNRNMNNQQFVLDVEVSNLLEELKEYLDADNDYDRVDALCDVGVFSINDLNYLGVNEVYFEPMVVSYGFYGLAEIVTSIHRSPVYKIAYAVRTSRYLIEEMDYDYKKCMLEAIKEISSRMQDPTQMEDWAKHGASGKWQKDKKQNPSTLYKADYNSCKI